MTILTLTLNGKVIAQFDNKQDLIDYVQSTNKRGFYQINNKDWGRQLSNFRKNLDRILRFIK